MVLLNFHECSIFVLELFQDSLFVLLLVFELGDLLDVVRFFELAPHVFDFFFIELDFGLTVPELFFFHLNGRVIRKLTVGLKDFCWNQIRVRAWCTVCLFLDLVNLLLPLFLHEVLKLGTQGLQLVFELFILAPQFDYDLLLFC